MNVEYVEYFQINTLPIVLIRPLKPISIVISVRKSFTHITDMMVVSLGFTINHKRTGATGICNLKFVKPENRSFTKFLL